MKNLIKAGILSLSLLCNQAKAIDLGFFYKITGGITYEAPITKRIDNVPQEIRDVNHVLIEEDSVTLYDRLNIADFMLGVGAKTDYFNIATGLGLETCLDLTQDQFKAKSERSNGAGNKPHSNYYSAYPRYGPNWNSFLRPSVFAQAEITPIEQLGLVLGYRVHQEKLMIEAGMDKEWRGEQVWERYELSSSVVGTTYASLRFYPEEEGDLEDWRGFVGLEAAVSDVLNQNVSKLGEECDLKQQTNFSIGLVGGITF